MKLEAKDEGRHLPGTDLLWGESWYHDFAAADGSYGGYLRLGLYPNQEIAWYWVHLVRRGEPLVVVRDHAVPGPTGPSTTDGSTPVEVASDRVRGSWGPVEPLWKYRITTEGTGVALADPADAFRGSAGRRSRLPSTSRGPASRHRSRTPRRRGSSSRHGSKAT